LDEDAQHIKYRYQFFLSKAKGPDTIAELVWVNTCISVHVMRIIIQ